MRWATLSSLVMGLVSNCNPWASIFIIQVQRGWCWRRGRRTSPFRNSNPYPIKDFACASKALPRLMLNLQKIWKFDSAASLFILNLKSDNSGHPLVNFTIYSMISIIFLGQILGDALMIIATCWDFLLGKVGSGSKVETLRRYGDL